MKMRSTIFKYKKEKRTAFALASPLLPKGDANAKGEGRIRAASRKSWTQRKKLKGFGAASQRNGIKSYLIKRAVLRFTRQAFDPPNPP